MKRLIAISLLLLCLVPVNAQKNRGTLKVNVTGFKNSTGKAGVTLFSSEKGFPMNDVLAVERLFADIEKSGCTVLLADVPYGVYAVSVFHDENANNRLDTNIIGMPKEGVGTSNNTTGKFGPPKFKDASFQLDTPDKQLNITIRYLSK